MKKRALITGVTGQDGSYLAEYLLGLGYEVWGLVRRTSHEPTRIAHLQGAPKGIKLVYGNLRDAATLEAAIAKADPHEIYNLAAQSHVGVSFTCPDETMDINYYGVGRLVWAAMQHNKKIRIYQASTSEMFGSTNPPQNEKSPFKPVSPYGEAKLRAHEDYVVGYREKHGLYICSGFLFNHESPRRGEQFVTRKITIALSKIKLGIISSFSLGNLEAKRDWGFAGDYVEAMHAMLQQDKPEDFVIATGKSHTVRQMVEVAAKELDMPITWSGKGLKEVAKTKNGKVILTINKDYYRPQEVDFLLGDSRKARRKLGWKPRHSFEDLVSMMVKSDFERLRKQKDAGLLD